MFFLERGVGNKHTRDPADLVNVFHNIFTTRFDVCKEGYTIRDILEIIYAELYAD